MIKNLKTIILSVFATLGVLLIPGLTTTSVSAQFQAPETSQSQLCQGGSGIQIPDGANTPADCATLTQGGTTKINELIKQIINVFSVIVGIVAVIMMIYGGLRYITSGGDSGNVTSAKNTILYAIIGLIIVALAQIIVKFVLNKATQPSGTGT